MSEAWNYVVIALAGGAAAFAHCLGMCGGFVLHLAQGPGRTAAVGRQALWHLGRVTTYVFLGALAGFLGARLLSAAAWAENVLAYAAGGAMILAGLVMLGLVPLARRGNFAEGGLVAAVAGQLFREPTPGSALGLGLMTGLLPCPITLGFLALAVQRGSVLVGMATMAALGLGTVWSLAALAMTGRLVTMRLRKWGPTVAAVVLVLLGVATALRGTEAFHHLLGCPPAPLDVTPASSACCEGK
jgi:sulfite exporter TauE/SafE